MALAINNSNLKFQWSYNNLTAIATGPTVTAQATWYLVEAKFVVSSTVGGVELKINGVTEFTSLGTNTSAVGTIDQVRFGGGGGGASVSQGWDDMMVCSGGYCPRGGTIARQGTTGTPSQNAWTKNSCAPASIDGCWSNTPFTTASSATSTTTGQQQSMIVATFGSTQSGHGSQALTGASIINACTTGVVAKAASAVTFYTSRLMNGTTTWASIPITTSDAYYTDGIWLPPAPLLNMAAPEVGVATGGSVLNTVEDMWVMCDAIPGPGPVPHRVRRR
jgi:hypothetical protein